MTFSEICENLRELLKLAHQFISECPAKADVIIALDSSASIRRDNYYEVLKYIKDLIVSFNVNNGQTRVGLVTFSTSAEVRFDDTYVIELHR